MAKSKFKSGDIVQIRLPQNLGFAYGQGVNLLELYPDTQYPTLLKIYNYRSTSFEYSLDEILNKEQILCPLLIGGILPTISKGGWKIIANIPLQEKDKLIPHYKRGEPDGNPKQWYYLIDADISKKVKSEYGKVKHLETIGATGSALVGTKIAMALLQDEGKEIKDYFELNDFFEKEYYEEVVSIPAYYKQPEFMRGKAIES